MEKDEEDYLSHLPAIHANTLKLVRERWTQGAHIRDGEGNNIGIGDIDEVDEDQVVAWQDNPLEKVESCCLEGAVIVSSLLQELNPYEMRDIFVSAWERSNPDIEIPLWKFNDDESTTQERVIETLQNMLPMRAG